MKIFLFNSLNPLPLKYKLFPEQRSAPFTSVPPLGLLSLAAAVKHLPGVSARIIDLNCEAPPAASYGKRFMDALYSRVKAKYLAGAAPGEPFLAGFQTLCTSHHFALALSRRLKRDYPNAIVLMGGPHASIVAHETLAAFPHVEMILSGEADESFPKLLRSLKSGGDKAEIPGLYYRAGDRVLSPRAAARPVPMARLPLPDYSAYHYPVDSYYIEGGRGCPFNCSYCTTSRFFGRLCRYKEAGRIREEAVGLPAFGRGRAVIHLIHDNFLGNKSSARHICKALIDNPPFPGFAWGCSARPDALSAPGTAALLRKAGVRAVFLGVESGAPAIQRSIGKNCSAEHFFSALEQIKAEKLDATCSFMCEFPEETPSDLEKTLRLCACCALSGVKFQLNPLIILPGTAMYRRYGAKLRFNASGTNREYDRGFLSAAESLDAMQRSRRQFSAFYAVPLKHPELKGLSGVVEFALSFFPYTVLALRYWSGSFRSIVDVCADLRGAAPAGPSELHRRLAAAVRHNCPADGPVTELFGYESACWRALIARPPAAAHAAGRITLSPGTAWAALSAPLEEYRGALFKAVKTGRAPKVPAASRRQVYLIHASADRAKGRFRLKFGRYPGTALGLARRLAAGAPSAGRLLATAAGHGEAATIGAYLLDMQTKGFISVAAPVAGKTGAKD